MPYNAKTGYVPPTFEEWMFNLFMPKINERYGTTYTADSFIGTQWYDILYPMIQALIDGDAEFADVWVKLSDFFDQVNARMQNPACVPDGIVGEFERNGLLASVRPVSEDNAGKIAVCIFADTSTQDIQAKIVNVLTNSVAGGIWSEGNKSATATLNNGQTITWRWYEPTDVTVNLRLTVYYTNNNGKSIPPADDIAEDLRQKLSTRYRYGTPFVPDLMYQISEDAPYALKLKLEWSDVGTEEWSSEIRPTLFNNRLIFDNINVLFQAV